MTMTFNMLSDWLRLDLSSVRDHMFAALDPHYARGAFEGILKDAVDTSGKMLRPSLMLLVAGDYDRAVRDELLATAAAYELGHTASLILDDVIDDADLRRGKPSVQSAYGVPVALCSSDYLLMAAQGHLLKLGYVRSAAEMAKVVRVMCAGEMVQFENLHNVDVSVDAYLGAIRGKTAHLFESCCGMSAQITGKDEEGVAAMRAFGDTLGIMFQVRDDLGDWTSTEESSGKPVNEDFSGGIYTLPAIHALSDEKVAGRLRVLAGKNELEPADLEEARELVNEAGGIAFARGYLQELAARADELLDVLAEGVHKDALKAIVKLVATA